MPIACFYTPDGHAFPGPIIPKSAEGPNILQTARDLGMFLLLPPGQGLAFTARFAQLLEMQSCPAPLLDRIYTPESIA